MRSRFAAPKGVRCMRFVTVGLASEIAPGQAKAFRVGDREVGVFNVDGTFYAIENTCPHQGGPLADGWIDGCIVTCPWHSWSFDLRTGQLIASSVLLHVAVFDVVVEDGRLAVAAEPRI